MSHQREYTEDDIRDMTQKEFRKEFPSGWMEVSRYETLVLIVDALLESSPDRKFGIEELAEKAGVVPESVDSHIHSLIDLGIVLKSDESLHSLNSKSPIVQDLFDLNLTVERVKSGELPRTIDRNDRVSGDVDNYNTSQDRASGRRKIETQDIVALSAD